VSAQPIPIDRYLVPATVAPPSDDYTRITQALVNGLPHVIEVESGIRLVLVLPNGVAVAWRDAETTAVVSRSADQTTATSVPAQEHPVGAVVYAPLRLYLERDRTTLASIPLVAGSRRTVPEAGGDGVEIELLVLAWDVRAGSLRGPGDFGSFVDLAWRRADKAGERFDVPALSPRVAARLETEFKLQSASRVRTKR
jgi:hypothetical protein